MDYVKILSYMLFGLIAVLSSVVSAEFYRPQGDIGSHEPVVRLRRQDGARVRRQGGHEGVTGPVHTYVKTDEHAHFKWGVRHHVGHEYAGRR